MPSWNEICHNMKKTATRAADKIGQSVDIATLQVKLSAAETKLDDAYADLGRLSYRYFLDQEVISEEQIENAMQCVQKREKICANLKAQIAQSKESNGAQS